MTKDQNSMLGQMDAFSKQAIAKAQEALFGDLF